MTAIKTLSIGTDQAPAQFPIRDFGAAISDATLAAGVAKSFTLAPGHYEVRADVAFTYKHGPALSVGGFVAVPHDANVWLGVATDKEHELVITPAAAGTVWIVPAEMY